MTGHHDVLWRVVHRDGSEWTGDELREYVNGDALPGALSETGPLKFAIDPTGCLYVHDMYGRYLCLGRESEWGDFRIEFTSR